MAQLAYVVYSNTFDMVINNLFCFIIRVKLSSVSPKINICDACELWVSHDLKTCDKSVTLFLDI